MRFPIPSLLARWAILGLILAIGSSAGFPLCSAGPNEISKDNHLNTITLRGMDTTARPQWSPDGRHIIFTNGGGVSDYVFSAGPGQITSEIYRVTADGSDLQLILVGEGPDEIVHSPRISPDGAQLVYVTTRHEVSEEEARKDLRIRRNFEIETAALDGTERRRLTENHVQDTRPVWSPDGSSIAFYRGQSGGLRFSNKAGTGIYTMAADGSDLELVFPRKPSDLITLSDMDPYFVYGHEFVLQRTLPDGTSIDPDALALTEYSGRLAGPTWSPDRKRIAFIAEIGYQQIIPDNGTTPPLAIGFPPTLYTANADGSDLTPVFSSTTTIVDNRIHTIDQLPTSYVPNRSASPVWSPDGMKIAFLRYVDDHLLDNLAEDQHVVGSPGFGLYEIGVDGSGLREIAILGTNRRYTGELSWSPGGKSLLLSTVGLSTYGRMSTPSQIHVIRIDGSVPLLTALGRDASWSPDGSRIAVVDSSSPYASPVYHVNRLYTMAPDGTDIQVIVERDEEGELRAVNQVEENCFLLLFCG